MKNKRKDSPRAQTTRFASFGPVLVAAAAFTEPLRTLETPIVAPPYPRTSVVAVKMI